MVCQFLLTEQLWLSLCLLNEQVDNNIIDTVQDLKSTSDFFLHLGKEGVCVHVGGNATCM